MKITASERKCQFLYGCSIAEALALNDGMALGARTSPIERYRQQRFMAEHRDIEWRLTFPQWKGIWDASGKWSKRGYRPGLAYMARKNNNGPFTTDNVFIAELPLKSKYAPVSTEEKAEKLAKRYGCSLSSFSSITEMKEVRRRFIEQRQRATDRGISWELTFSDWWGIWKESGMWEARGRESGASAVMSRFGDEGPYSKDNVRITTLAENFSEYWQNAPRRRVA